MTFDVIIIGTGAGGGTVAHALSESPARILILERGDFIPQEEENWDPEAVWKHLRYQTKELWLDARGRAFNPYSHYNVGGNSKFWGSVLYRLRREDFGELRHMDGVSPAWPIDYDTLAPYYDRAERLYQVHGEGGLDPTDPPRGPFPFPPVPHSPAMGAIVEQLISLGLHPSPLPLGLLEGCVLCSTCNSFACKVHAKSEADVCCVRPALQRPTVTLWTNARARRLITDASGRRVETVEVERNGETIRVAAPLVVVACGAVNSAALLLRSGGPGGLANSSGLVGRNYMAHVTTMFSAYRWDAVDAGPHAFHKTIAINDYYRASDTSPYPLGHIQSQGSIHPEMVQGGAPQVLKLGLKAVLGVFPGSLKHWTDHSIQWLAMTEDLPLPENRVTLQGDRIRLDYRPNNMQAHRELRHALGTLLRDLGFSWIFPLSFGVGNTTHQCGTLRFGTDPRTSVLNPLCRTHDVENLFVVDASFFPSAAAVNPALTIIAQALRVADHIAETHLGSRLRAPGFRMASSIETEARSAPAEAHSPKPVAQ